MMKTIFIFFTMVLISSCDSCQRQNSLKAKVDTPGNVVDHKNLPSTKNNGDATNKENSLQFHKTNEKGNEKIKIVKPNSKDGVIDKKQQLKEQENIDPSATNSGILRYDFESDTPPLIDDVPLDDEEDDIDADIDADGDIEVDSRILLEELLEEEKDPEAYERYRQALISAGILQDEQQKDMPHSQDKNVVPNQKPNGTITPEMLKAAHERLRKVDQQNVSAPPSHTEQAGQANSNNQPRLNLTPEMLKAGREKMKARAQEKTSPPPSQEHNANGNNQGGTITPEMFKAAREKMKKVEQPKH